MTGNTSNTSNTSNTGNAANTGAISGSFFPDRVDLPFVDEVFSRDRIAIAKARIAPAGDFAPHDWAAAWWAWKILEEFVKDINWESLKPEPKPGAKATGDEIETLVRYAVNERADALGEILAQSNEFRSDFLNLLMATPQSYPRTYRLLHIAELVGTLVVMHFKREFNRRRPSQVCPALRPPLSVPGHASYPSGHSTQAHLMALCVTEALEKAANPEAVEWLSRSMGALANRIARNREIAGLHYPSDSEAGEKLAKKTFDRLKETRSFTDVLDEAAKEWIIADREQAEQVGG